jgi:hypothetical protein
MEDNPSPTVRSVLPLTLALMIPGWSMLIYLMTSTSPNLGNRWMFFVSAVLAVSGIFLPLIAYLNRFIQPFGPANYETVVRESTLLGVYAGILLWLNKGQVLTAGLALILGVGLVLIELLIRLRKRSQWQPDEYQD